MTTTIRTELLEGLLELSAFCPQMRFGQLLAAVAARVGAGYMQDANDNQLAESLEHLIAQHRQRERVEVPPVRGELTQAVEELSSRVSDWPLGLLVFRLASIAHLNVYDAEDEELLAAAREHPGVLWFESYSDKLRDRSILAERKNKPSYPCPCCQAVTLYERGGFEICPVCYWEDDGQDEADASAVWGGPNGNLSLSAARANYRQHAVSDPVFADHVRPPRPTELQATRGS